MTGEEVPALSVRRIRSVLMEIERACTRSGRPKDSVELLAVSKMFDVAAIIPVLEFGHRSFGENRVAEAKKKWPQLLARYPDVRLHLIGPLQTNKVRDAVALFDVIHSLDRERLASELKKACDRSGKNVGVYVQVNTGAEPQKHGVAVSEVEEFVQMIKKKYDLNVLGLMAIPPVDGARTPHFLTLNQLRLRCGLRKCSMGMSQDFEIAIEQGADVVRLGSRVFGERPVPGESKAPGAVENGARNQV